MALAEVVVDVIEETTQPALLNTFTLAVLSLLSMSPNLEAAEAEYLDLNSEFSHYEEGKNRIKVDVYQAAAAIPLTDRLNFRVNSVKDIVTGASPVTNTLKSNGQVSQMMSGASIKDVRDSIDGTATYKHDYGSLSLGGGVSTENDYTSNFFNIDSRLDFNQKTTTLETGYGFSSDRVWAVDHCPPHCLSDSSASLSSSSGLSDSSSGLSSTSTLSSPPAPSSYKRPNVGGDKTTHQGIVGVTQILDKDSLLQANLTYTYSQGYLSDPYKVVYTPWVTTPYPFYSDAGGYSHDTRPTNRNQVAILTRYVRHFSKLNSAAVHLDYRFYADTWGVIAHTFEATWIQPIWQDWKISPTVRYYTQGSADFYQPYFLTPRADGYYSSDYRLAQFGSLGGGLQLSKEFFDQLTLGFGVDFYERRNSYSLNSGAGTSVDNFNFSMYNAKINFKF